MAWVMRRKDVKSGWYVCFRTADGREVRRAAGKSRRSAESIKSKIETQLREGKFFEREARSTWTLAQLAHIYLERLTRLRPRAGAARCSARCSARSGESTPSSRSLWRPSIAT